MPVVIILLVVAIIAGVVISQQGNGKNKKDSRNSGKIDYSFLMGISPNYALLGDPDWTSKLKLVADHNGNMLRVFAYCGWGDNFVYKPWDGNNITNINQGFINGLKSFVKQSNAKGICVLLSLFHKNGDPFSYAMGADKEKVKTYTKALVNATKDMGIIYETINEDVDSRFTGWVLEAIKEVWANARTCVYNAGAGTYRIEHTNSQSYIGGKKIHSNDKAGYVKVYTDNSYYNITKQAKEQGGHVEWLISWGRKPEGLIKTVAKMEEQYGTMLDRIKELR